LLPCEQLCDLEQEEAEKEEKEEKEEMEGEGEEAEGEEGRRLKLNKFYEDLTRSDSWDTDSCDGRSQNLQYFQKVCIK
jgi:hypothetical protein